MTALAAARDTRRASNNAVFNTHKVLLAANAIVFEGGMVAWNASGFGVPASASATLKVVGRAKVSADNTGGANGAIAIEVEAGCFSWTNSSIAAVDQDDVGKVVYAEDDQTISETDQGGTLSAAGVFYGFDDYSGVLVKTSFC